MARHPVVQELIASTSSVGDADTLVGLFQAFRPNGLPLLRSLEALPGGSDFASRLQSLFEAVSASRRGDNMKDAYFIVRSPSHGCSDFLTRQAELFVGSVLELIRSAGIAKSDTIGRPDVRLLEGKPPKHPKAQREKSELLLLFQERVPGLLSALFRRQDHSAARLAIELEDALYFVACDSWLREYLRLPLLGDSPETKVADRACLAYFELWRHGIKYRIFSDQRIDFYNPRRADGTLIDAGQFAFR